MQVFALFDTSQKCIYISKSVVKTFKKAEKHMGSEGGFIPLGLKYSRLGHFFPAIVVFQSYFHASLEVHLLLQDINTSI